MFGFDYFLRNILMMIVFFIGLGIVSFLQFLSFELIGAK